MFYHFGHESFKVIEPAPGFLVRAISGKNAMLCDVTLQPHSESPLHSHPSEEVAIIIEGEFDMKMGDESQLLKQGDVFLAPPGVIHGGVTHEHRMVMISAFSPPRKDYE
jgi:quercetin dioxygenase-like cupin family protein